MNEDIPPARPEHVPEGDEGQNEAIGEPIAAHTGPHPEEPQALQPVPSVRVDDIHKAETMAYAEDEFRTRAVENRNVWHVPEYDQIKQIDHRLDEPSLKRRQRRQLEREKSELEETVRNSTYRRSLERHEAEDRTSRQFAEDFPEAESGKKLFILPDSRAAFYDRQASRIGDWAGRLHDHPLSQAFQEAHPDMELTPKSIVRLENEAADMQAEIERGSDEESHETRQAMYRLLDPDRAILPALDDIDDMLVTAGDRDLIDEGARIKAGLLESADELDAFHARLIQEVKIPDLRNKLAMTRRLLSDIRQEVGLPAEDAEADSADLNRSQDGEQEVEPVEETVAAEQNGPHDGDAAQSTGE